MAEPTSRVISLTDITKTFPGVVANDRVSLEIASGEVHCLLGENGAGKSTLISILAGLQRPDSGTIAIDGVPVSLSSPAAAVKHGIGVVHQHSTLVPAFTVLENLMLGERGLTLNTARAVERLTHLADVLGVTIDPRARAGDLDLAQQQQVEIAKAMWKGTRLLILDEPTSMLTPQAIERLTQSLARVKAQGLAILFITHKLREAYEIADCVTVLRAGKNVGHLSRDQLASSSQRQAEDAMVAAMFGPEGDVAAPHLAPRPAPKEDFRPSVRLELSSVSTTGEGGIRDVGFTVYEHEILGVAGIDGHGQTALAEAIAGQRAVTAGSVRLDGQDVTRLGVRQRQSLGLRYVTDDRLNEGTVGSLSVALNLVLKRIGQRPLWRFGRIDRTAVDAEAARLIDEFAIRTPSPSTRVATLSGGNIQKVLLARELASGARFVVVNKPTHGLDLKTVGLVRSLLVDFAATGGAVLLLSNDLDELIELSHRIIVISDGEIVGDVPANEPGVAERVGQLMVGSRGSED